MLLLYSWAADPPGRAGWVGTGQNGQGPIWVILSVFRDIISKIKCPDSRIGSDFFNFCAYLVPTQYNKNCSVAPASNPCVILFFVCCQSFIQSLSYQSKIYSILYNIVCILQGPRTRGAMRALGPPAL